MQSFLESDPFPELAKWEFISQRISALALSLGFHLVLITGALLIDWSTSGSAPEYTVVRKIDLSKNEPLFYYSAIKTKTPQISPSPTPKPPTGKSPGKPTIRTFNSNRTVPQIVWRPLRIPELPKPAEAPNMVVMTTEQKEIAAAPPPKAPVRTFKAPERRRTAVRDEALFSDTPVLSSAQPVESAKLNIPSASGASKIDATAPPAPKPVTASIILDQAGGVTAVVAGENPSASLRDPLSGRRSGVVSSGGAPGPSKPGGGPGIVVPGVAVDSSEGKVVVPAVKPPPDTPEPPPPQIYRRPGLAAPLRPSSRNIPPAVEAQFRNRTVYTCLVDRGSDFFARDWVIWFAEQSAAAGEISYVRPPVPGIRPQVPFDNVPGPAPAGSLFLIAAISKEGRLEQLGAPAGSGSPWTMLFAQSLSKWRFLPALRAQIPIAIDVVIEVPLAISR